MKTNISALMNLIAEEEKNFTNICYEIKGYLYNTSVEELDGRVTIIEDTKDDFDLCLEKIEKCNKELSKLKAVLYEKNNSFKLTDGRSIQEAIVDNTNLRKLKSCFESILYAKSSKKRVTEVNNSYFESKVVNFDSKKIKKRLEEIDLEIQNTDFEISKLNSIEFEI